MALHFAARPKSNADKGLRWARIENHREIDKVGLVDLPTTDGRELTLSRYTQPQAEHRLLLDQLRLNLPSQPPPKITAAQARHTTVELTL